VKGGEHSAASVAFLATSRHATPPSISPVLVSPFPCPCSGGYLEGDLATPKNLPVRRAFAALLTPPLARRLSRTNPESLLKSLNGNEESGSVVWTPAMRKELLAFVSRELEGVNRTGAADMGPAGSFLFTSTREELRVAGVYVRFYIADPSISLDDPFVFAAALLTHIARSKAGGALPGEH
jgi:hypothetical protein